MDNKEAAEVIAAMRKHEIDILKINAFELAIKALEQEPDAIHNEREQAYMKGYEDASKKYRTEPCEDWYDVPSDEMTLGQARQAVKDLRKMWAEHLWQEPCADAISRSDAIRVASGYCHWTNIPKELAKLPSVNPIPCEDAISRQAAIEAINNICPVDTEYDCALLDRVDVRCVLSDLPSVSTERTGQWVPVSEMLPEDGIYLVTVERITGKPRIETKSFAKDLNRVDDYIFRKHKCGWYDYDSEYGCWEDTNVIAWMPLPHPYKEESEDEK